MACGTTSPWEYPQVSHRLTSGDEAGPFVAWTADDGYSWAADNFFVRLNGLGIGATLFLTPDYVDKSGSQAEFGPYITTAQVQDIYAESVNEIGTHGGSDAGDDHISYVSKLLADGADGLEEWLDAAIQFIRDLVDDQSYQACSGSYPFGDSNRRVRQVVGRNHLYYRGIYTAINEGAPDPFNVHSVNADHMDSTRLEELRDLADVAAQNNALLVLNAHGETEDDDYADNIEALATYIQDVLQIPQGTFGDAMYARTTRLGVETFEDTRGGAFFADVRTQRIELARDDTINDSFHLAYETAPSGFAGTPFIDATPGDPTFEFRIPAKTIKGLEADCAQVWLHVTRKSADEMSATATLWTPEANGFAVDDIVQVEGVVSDPNPFNGTHTVTGVGEDANGHYFTFEAEGEVTAGPATGRARKVCPDDAEILLVRTPSNFRHIVGIQREDLPIDIEPGQEVVLGVYNHRAEDVLIVKNNGSLSLGGVGNLAMGQAAWTSGGRVWGTQDGASSLGIASVDGVLEIKCYQVRVIDDNANVRLTIGSRDDQIEMKDADGHVRYRLGDGGIETLDDDDNVMARLNSDGTLQLRDDSNELRSVSIVGDSLVVT